MITPDFQTLRDQWAVKLPVPDSGEVAYERQKDRNANPHNEHYANSKPLRGTAEIISDVNYKAADAILTKQYGSMYTEWLKANNYVEKWGVTGQRF